MAVLPTCRSVSAVEHRPTAWGWSAPRVGPQHNHANSALRGACSAGRRPLLHGAIRTRDARRMIRTHRARAIVPLTSTYRGVGAVPPRPTAWGGARRALTRTTTTCLVRTAWRVLRGPSAATPWCDTRAGRAPRDSNALVKTFRILRRQPVAALCGRASADGVGRSTLLVGLHHNHANSALCGACSAVRRPLRHGAIRARDVCHGTRTRWSRSLESSAADWSQCWCGRVSADCVGRSAPRVGPHHNHAKSALRGALRGPSAATPWCDTRAERAPQDSNALAKILRIVHHQSIAVLCGRASADSVGRSAARVSPYHNHAKSALRSACFAGGWPILHGAKFARATCRGVQSL